MNEDWRFRTPGVVLPPREMYDPEEMKPPVPNTKPEPAGPRPDGKALCEYLRSLRKELAKANGIEYKTIECTYEGTCSGTCYKCDEEIRYLNDEIGKIPASERVYPTMPKYEPEKPEKGSSILREWARKKKEKNNV